MKEYKIIPKVDETQEFIEIANDFSNPLDIVREGISNAFDAKANKVEIIFSVLNEFGEKILNIEIIDNGVGMNEDGLQSFFDLGNSTRRNDESAIGEKGHGTKVYLNSSEIKVMTTRNGKSLTAIVKEPYKSLFNRQIPEVNVFEEDGRGMSDGTHIKIKGYNKNRRDMFTHEILKDYILWFTKFGSFEKEIAKLDLQNCELKLKGLNKEHSEIIKYGHIFPEENSNVEKLFERHIVRAREYYCKKIVRKGQLKNFPEIKYDAIFCVEGNKVKQ